MVPNVSHIEPIVPQTWSRRLYALSNSYLRPIVKSLVGAKWWTSSFPLVATLRSRRTPLPWCECALSLILGLPHPLVQEQNPNDKGVVQSSRALFGLAANATFLVVPCVARFAPSQRSHIVAHVHQPHAAYGLGLFVSDYVEHCTCTRTSDGPYRVHYPLVSRRVHCPLVSGRVGLPISPSKGKG